MKKILIYYALATTVIAGFLGTRLHRTKYECARLKINQQALFERLEQQDSLLYAHEASVEVLRLRCREFEQLRAADAATIRKQGIRLRELMSHSEQVTLTELQCRIPLKDSIHQPTLNPPASAIALRARTTDTLRAFRWTDAWNNVEGVIHHDTVTCRIRSIDTLHQIVRRIPRRFLFIRWGTKAIRQEIRSSNPHTKLVYSDFLLIEP